MSSQWNTLGDKNQQRSGKVNNLKLEIGKIQVRFIGVPTSFSKYFVNNKSAVTANPKTNPVKIKYGLDPTERYAINVIDRRDGQLKVLECPITVLKPVINWSDVTKRNPGADNSVDFVITVTGAGTNRRYAVINLNESPLTADEKKMILEVGGTENGYDLDRLYKAVPDEEIEARLFGKATPQTTANIGQTTTVVAATPQVASVGQTVEVKKNDSEDIPF